MWTFGSFFGAHTMKRPFMLAQVALKAYAAAFAVLLFYPPPIILPFTLYNVAASAVIIGILLALLYIAKGLSKGKAWAQIGAAIVFIGFAVVTVPTFLQALADKGRDTDFWIQLWSLTMSSLGLIGLIVQRPRRAAKTSRHVRGET